MSRPYDVIVFDWDGTLADSVAQIVTAMRGAIAQMDLPPRTDAQMRNVIGLDLFEAVNTLYPEMNRETWANLVQQYRHQFISHHQTTVLFTGAEDVLAQLRAQGYWLAVATGKSARGLARSLDELDLHATFAATRTADKTASKPNPLMLEEILIDLDTAPARALMVGDTEYDLEMAVNANVPRIGVSYGVHEVVRLERHQPLTILDDIRQLPAWLEQG